MNLNFFKESNLSRGKKPLNSRNGLVNSFIKELSNSLEKELYTLDRFEGDLAVCQNRKTGEIKNIDRNEIPKEAEEGQVLKWNGNKYEIDYKETDIARERVRSKFDRLMKKPNE